MLTALAISNYRSLRDLVVPLDALNLVTGPNGSGKSNVYRALRLLAATAQGDAASSLSREGGLESALWAGPEAFSRSMRSGEHPVQGGPRREPVQLRLGFSGGDQASYAIDLGLPAPGSSMFSQDAEIKRECIWSGPVLRPSALLVDRRGPLVRIRRDDGDWDVVAEHMAPFDGIFTQLADPQRAPEVMVMRDQIRSWRFYDHFRTDPEAPARQPQIATRTPVLAHDGHDLASAIQTIREIGDARALDEAIEDAFPGSRLEVDHGRGRIGVALRQHGLLRTLAAAELSDGTLRYLLWIAALLTPRPPKLMVLNEPETSLHPDLLPALARLIGVAARSAQVMVVSHASRLVAALERIPGCHGIVLEKELGETRIADAGLLDAPAWKWPAR
jgi:predicted ATPase